MSLFSQSTTQETQSQNRSMPISPKMRSYIRRLAAKRRSQIGYRRGSSGASTTPATRTLSRAVNQYRYSNPMYIQPSNARTASFWRTLSYSIPINEQLGWGALGSPCIGFSFGLRYINIFLGGAFFASLDVSNAAEFQALFDTYKINAVRMKMFFTNNNSSVNSPATGLPLLHIVNDFDDAIENLSVNTILERAGVRTIQYDATNAKGISHWVKPAAKMVVQQTDRTTGVTSVSDAGVPMGATWIDTAVSNVMHNGIKIVYNNQGRNNNTDIGSVTFMFEIEYTFKGYR